MVACRNKNLFSIWFAFRDIFALFFFFFVFVSSLVRFVLRHVPLIFAWDTSIGIGAVVRFQPNRIHASSFHCAFVHPKCSSCTFGGAANRRYLLLIIYERLNELINIECESLSSHVFDNRQFTLQCCTFFFLLHRLALGLIVLFKLLHVTTETRRKLQKKSSTMPNATFASRYRVAFSHIDCLR